MFIAKERHPNIRSVYLETNTFWYSVVAGTFKENGEHYDSKVFEWVPVYKFDFLVPRTSERRTMTVASTAVLAVQEV